VPSALAIYQAGSPSVWRNKGTLLEAGFALEQLDSDGNKTILEPKGRNFDAKSASSSIKSWLSGDTKQPEIPLQGLNFEPEELPQQFEDNFDELEDDSLDSETGEESEILEEKGKPYLKIHYLEYFRVIQTVIYLQTKGQQADIVFWGGDTLRLQDTLPKKILGKAYKGKRGITFHKIASGDVQNHVIFKRTYWGRRLTELASSAYLERSHEDDPAPVKTRNWARRLMGRIKAFLAGLPDPNWGPKGTSRIYADFRLRNRKSRALRFLEMLKTVDGMFVQRFLVAPEEAWTYQKVDDFFLSSISYLIGDEFLDGPLQPEVLEWPTSYELLKKVRGKMKKCLLAEKDKDYFFSMVGHLPQALRYFFPLFDHVVKFREEPLRYSYMVGILSQKRGAGKPPHVVTLKSKVKFLKTVSKPTPPLNPTEIGLIRAAMDSFLEDQDPTIFTGLTTKARVTVTTAACLEKTQADGGTLSAVQQMVVEGKQGFKVPIRDLNTAAVLKWVTLQECTVGEYIFWCSLDYVLRMTPEELSRTVVVMVKEPGKSRTVTKGPACLKIVLDVLNRICSWPLKKVKSSTSGMEKSNHGWNLFKSFFEEAGKDILFRTRERHEEKLEGTIHVTESFEDCFVSSTDYETATDNMHHQVAYLLAKPWLTKCGAPKVLSEIALRICFQPRTVLFHADACLDSIGEPSQSHPGMREVRLCRGLLMGDPLTKVVLHLTNIVARQFANIKLQCLSRYFTNAHEVHRRLQEFLRLGVRPIRAARPAYGRRGTSNAKAY
jgi:hypothetical protein